MIRFLKKKIPYGRQLISRDDIQAVIQVLKSDYITQGPAIARFEKAIAGFCGAKYAVAFSSGTASLHAACFAAGISKGDEVITTPMTFAASANCVLYCGGTPILVDIHPDLPLIDPGEIARKITKKTKAIIPVDYSGIPADYDEINKLANKHNLLVIADAAHSLGAIYKGRKIGTLADMTVFSFHPVKLITTGEGGMVATDNYKFYQKLLLFRTHGITKDQKLLQQKNIGPWYYEMQELGYNYRLTDIQAALGLSQLKKAQRFLSKRNTIARQYQKLLSNSSDISFLNVPNDRTSAWHLFPIQLARPKLIQAKKQIVENLHKHGIMVQVHYIPVHLHPYYIKAFNCKRGDFPHAENFYQKTLSLPLYPALQKSDLHSIITLLGNVMN